MNTEPINPARPWARFFPGNKPFNSVNNRIQGIIASILKTEEMQIMKVKQLLKIIVKVEVQNSGISTELNRLKEASQSTCIC